MLKVQEFLLHKVESGYSFLESLDSLKEELGIKYSFYEDEKCVVLSYSQVDSPKENEIVRECRGLILSSDFKKILCKPFTRFFNYSEFPECAKSFDFSTSEVSEKIDGTLISFYYNPVIERWCYSTRNKAFSEGTVSDGRMTYADLVRKSFSVPLTDERLDSFFSGYRDYTFSFEFVSLENKVVTRYYGYHLYFLGMHSNIDRNYIKNGKEIFSSLCEKSDLFQNVKFPRVYQLSNYDEIQSFMKELDATDEGFVCYDYVHDIRVKVKNPRYFEIASKRINGVITKERLLEIIIANEKDEYLSYFPEDKFLFTNIEREIGILKIRVLSAYEEVKNIESRKEFAMTVKNWLYSNFFFKLKDGYTFEEILSTHSAKKIVEMFF